MYFWSNPITWLKYSNPLAVGLCGDGIILFKIPRIEFSFMSDSIPLLRWLDKSLNKAIAVTWDSPYLTMELSVFFSWSILYSSSANYYSVLWGEPLLNKT